MLTEEGKISITTFACIEISPLAVQNPPKTDWIFFYSPTSTRLFFERFEYLGQKIGAIGKGTGAALMELGIGVTFQSEKDNTEEVIAAFVQKVNPSETVLSPIGNLSLRRLEGELDPSQLITFKHYETKAKIELPIASANYLLMTSPSNAQAYFSQHKLQPGQKVVAIGPTTDSALEKLGIENKIASQIPSEEGFWKAIQEDLKNKSV